MDTDISVEAVAGKLNRVGYEAFLQGLRQAKGAGQPQHRTRALADASPAEAIAPTSSSLADHYKLDVAALLADVTAAVNGFRKNETEMPGISTQVSEMLDRGWHYATLLFGETQIRTGHVLVAMLKSRRRSSARSPTSPSEFAKIQRRRTRSPTIASIWRDSEEGNLRPMDGSGIAAAGTAGADGRVGAEGNDGARPFRQDLTAKARSGDMDPILGRDEEIRQIVDVLMRRRQNNPILTGEAGVGKTAVVEGFAQRIAAGDVPPPLKGVTVCVARRRADAGGRLDEGRIRTAPALGDRRGAVLADADHPVHRRGAYADRRRRARRARATPPTCSSRRWRAAR